MFTEWLNLIKMHGNDKPYNDKPYNDMNTDLRK